jgi:hypothetical protein
MIRMDDCRSRSMPTDRGIPRRAPSPIDAFMRAEAPRTDVLTRRLSQPGNFPRRHIQENTLPAERVPRSPAPISRQKGGTIDNDKE